MLIRRLAIVVLFIVLLIGYQMGKLMKGEKLLDLIMQMLEQEFGIAVGHMFLLMQLLQKFLACLKLDFI